jgi:hypothetical protein
LKNDRALKSPIFTIISKVASIKLGVVIIVALGSITAWGTFVEAHYNDSVAAQKIVYNSVWMYSAMGALAISLIAVMIDRWPWQKKHTGFVLAHIGILTIMSGSLITHYFGLDGSMSLAVGENSAYVLTDKVVLAVYGSLGGNDTQPRKMGEEQVDFFLNRPSAEKPFVIPLAGGDVRVVDYLPYAFREEKVVDSNKPFAGAGVRFQLQNSRVSVTEWLVQPGPGRTVSKNLGPAQVFFTSENVLQAVGHNAIVLRAKYSKEGKASDTLEYEIHTEREPKKIKRGVIHAGESLETGWMGLVLRVLKFLPAAEEKVTYKANDQATPMSMSAIKVKFNNEEQWLGLNSMVKLFTDQAVYILSFANARHPVGFDLRLKEFKVGRYPGTMRAASYESLVDVPGIGERTISMNEPLKFNGYTFYQSSFQEDETGHPVASIFSVNKDPGRWIKYLGALMIVSGIIHLFSFKRKSGKAPGKLAANPAHQSADKPESEVVT